MKKVILILMSNLVLFFCHAQSNLLDKKAKADSLLKIELYKEAYDFYKDIFSKIKKKDLIYNDVLWDYLRATTMIEHNYRMNEKFDTALIYADEALKLIEIGIPIFGDKFEAKKYWMHKNLLVSYFELSKFDKFEKERDFMYKSYAKKELPDGIDEYYNYSYFKWKDKNVWGYEWYPEIPDDRFSSSFTKIVYYVYSTNPDGSDKDQLFRFHVLMFHQSTKKPTFDYILERQINEDDVLVSGSYYSYVYKKKIDYVKLKKDIIEILEKNIQPDSRRTTRVR